MDYLIVEFSSGGYVSTVVGGVRVMVNAKPADNSSRAYELDNRGGLW